MNSSYLQEWLVEKYKPCALVYCSPTAKNSLLKNNLSPADFLRPLGDFQNKKIEFNLGEKIGNISFKNFQLDFYDNTKFEPIEKKDIPYYLFTMYQNNIPNWTLNCPILTKKNKDPYLDTIKDSYSSQWYKEYEDLYFECERFDEYELFQQPILQVFIICINEDENIINELNKKGNLPKLIFNERYEAPKKNLLIVLTDMQNENNKLSQEEKTNKKNSINSHFKSYERLFWEINKQETTNEQEIIGNSALWQKYFHKTDLYNPNNDFYRDKNKKFGTFISYSDFKNYKNDFSTYFLHDFIDYVKKKINELAENIKKNKGNKLTGLFKKKGDILFYYGSYVYKFTELERNYYNLALFYFYFHVYEAAYETFKTLYSLIKEKSVSHKEKLKDFILIAKYIRYNVSPNKKEFNLGNEEIKIKLVNNKILNIEQVIKKQIILIKYLEENQSIPLLINKTLEFINIAGTQFKIEQNLSILDFYFPLLYEKIGIYYITQNKYRKFLYSIFTAGKCFSKLGQNMKVYGLYCYSNLLSVVDEPSYSFIEFRKYINNKMCKICNKINYIEGGFKFSKNSLEFSFLYDGTKKFEDNRKKTKKDKEVQEQEMRDEQSYHISIYLNMIHKIRQNKIISNNIDLNSLQIPQVDNGSLFILEENDNIIKNISNNIITKNKPWSIFNHYKESMLNNPYANLDVIDLSRLKLLDDLTIDKNRQISNFHTRRDFFGNINQKLYIKCNLHNPLLVILQVSSVSLYCDFIPEKKSSDNNISNDNNDVNSNIICSEKQIILNSKEDYQLILDVTAKIPGKITVKGLKFILFKDCTIIHLFNAKNKDKLYKYRKGSQSERKTSIKSNNSRDSSRSGSENSSRKNSINNYLIPKIPKIVKISKKAKIHYFIKDYNDDIYVNFPLGLNLDLYLYQVFFYPIELNNNSKSHRIRRFTIFIENSDDKKLKNFFSYITKEIELNEEYTKEVILIPILPISIYDNINEAYIKLVIKFADEMRIKPIEVKRFLIKINIKNSLSFEIKESFNNLFAFDKFSNSFNKIDFDLKTHIYMKNKNIQNLVIKDPIYNNKYNLYSKKDNLLNENEILKVYKFTKDNKIPLKKENENENKFEFIYDNDSYLACKNLGIKEENNKHIPEKFYKILFNNYDTNTIFFPFSAEIKENNTDQTLKMQGLYIYKLNLNNPKISKNFIREIFYNSTELKVSTKKINKEKTLIMIDLSLNKNGIVSLNSIIYKYEIFLQKEIPGISNFGLKKYTINNSKINESNNNIFICKFHFITTYKGIFEANRISVLLYKKPQGEVEQTPFMEINHITKPFSILIE